MHKLVAENIDRSSPNQDENFNNKKNQWCTHFASIDSKIDIVKNSANIFDWQESSKIHETNPHQTSLIKETVCRGVCRNRCNIGITRARNESFFFFFFFLLKQKHANKTLFRVPSVIWMLKFSCNQYSYFYLIQLECDIERKVLLTQLFNCL